MQWHSGTVLLASPSSFVDLNVLSAFRALLMEKMLPSLTIEKECAVAILDPLTKVYIAMNPVSLYVLKMGAKNRHLSASFSGMKLYIPRTIWEIFFSPPELAFDSQNSLVITVGG